MAEREIRVAVNVRFRDDSLTLEINITRDERLHSRQEVTL